MNEQVSLSTQLLDALLLDYATGTLSPALEVLVETHLAMNPHSAETMQMLMKLGGVLLEDTEPVSLSEGALASVFEQIEQEERASAEQDNIASFSTAPAKPLLDLLPSRDCKTSWRRVGIGVFEYELEIGGVTASFYRIAPGRAVPVHSHDGTEVSLVLEGGFTDEFGSYGPGDIAIQEQNTEHQPVADDDGECIVFAVNEGAIRLTGPIGRMLNMIVKN